MGEAIVMQLPAIIFAAAALVASISTMISVIKNHAKLEANNAKLDAIGTKVDGGLTAMMNALAEIATHAQASASTANKTVIVKEGQRSTDATREP